MAGGHSHGSHGRTAAGAHARPLAWTLALTGGFLIVEVVGALWTGSLALLADAGHMLTDVAGLALALFAIWFAAKPPTPEKTYGYYRVEILAALVNAPETLGCARTARRRFTTTASAGGATWRRASTGRSRTRGRPGSRARPMAMSGLRPSRALPIS